MKRVTLAQDSEDSGFASMLSTLLEQNLEAKPHKCVDFDRMVGNIAIVADDADVAVTLKFQGGHAIVHDGIRGIPDVTVRGPTDTIMALSNIPLTRRLALPVPELRNKDARRDGTNVLKTVYRSMRAGELKVHGMFFHFGLVNRLTRVMSIHG